MCKVVTEHPDLFAAVKPIVAKIVLSRWATVCKHTLLPVFVRNNMEQLSLVMTRSNLQKVADAGENWLSVASDAVLALAADGLCGGGMFSVKVRDIVEANLQTAVVEALDLRLQKFLDDGKGVVPPIIIDVDMIEHMRDEVILSVQASVVGLHNLPHKRQVCVPYRGVSIVGVQLTSGIVDLVTLHMMSRIKAAGVQSGKLIELEAEKLLGCKSADIDGQRVVGTDVYEKAILFLLA